MLPLTLLACLGEGTRTWPLGAALLLLGLVCWWDDRHGLNAGIRFGAQCLAALLALGFGLTLSPLALLVCLILVVWGANLFNFMDGANGLAGSMMLSGFSCYAVVSYATDPALAGVSATLAGAAIGFLLFNWDPARLFLGDLGSVPAGFAMTTLGIYGWENNLWPFWFPWLVFSPFIADASVTLLRRLLRRERIWQAHREHFYQRLILSGVSHRDTALLWLAMMLVSAALAIVLRQQSGVVVTIGLALQAALLLAVATWIELRWRSALKARV